MEIKCFHNPINVLPSPPEMTDESKEKERELIKNAVEVFMTYGIKSVTMDDMARHMRVSKKTIYQYVKDKGDLVNKCMNRDCGFIQDRIEEVLAENLNAIDENFSISRVVINELRNIHPSIFYDRSLRVDGNSDILFRTLHGSVPFGA